MQIAKKINKIDHYFPENILEFKLKVVEKKQVKKIEEDKEKTCFQTDERYFCKDNECSCSNECKKLIAAWMR
jgi:hypothetical protein